MPTAKKTAAPDADPAETPAEAVQPAAAEPEHAAAAAPVVESAPQPANLAYIGPIAMVVAGVGPCVPGCVYPVPESVAVDVCRGDSPLFVRVTPAA